MISISVSVLEYTTLYIYIYIYILLLMRHDAMRCTTIDYHAIPASPDENLQSKISKPEYVCGDEAVYL